MKMSSAGQTMGMTCSAQPKSLAESVSGLWMFLCHVYMDNTVGCPVLFSHWATLSCNNLSGGIVVCLLSMDIRC